MGILLILFPALKIFLMKNNNIFDVFLIDYISSICCIYVTFKYKLVLIGLDIILLLEGGYGGGKYELRLVC